MLLETGEVPACSESSVSPPKRSTSGPLKDQPSYTQPLTPEGREVLHGLVMDMYDQFVGMVATGRHMTPDAVRALAEAVPTAGVRR